MCIDFEGYTDEEIISLIKNNNDDAMEYLIKKHGYIVKREIRTVFLIGADTDDLVQEGMIGLFKAIRDYEENKGASFATFATLCVRRQIQTAIKNSNRKKHFPLNSAISLYTEDESGAISVIAEKENGMWGDDGSNPEDVIIEREERIKLAEKIRASLSSYEKKTLVLYLGGLSRSEMAQKLGRSEKSIDNALSRIRNKLSLT